MREIDDVRKKASHYELAAHLTACLALFLFKSGSRNHYNQKREDLQFQQNYEKLFGFPMPHGDSVHNVIELLDEQQVQHLKQKMARALLERKVFHGSRYRGKWYRIAVDASGVVSFSHQHCEQCLHKTSKTGKTTYFHNVLDARLVTPNGFSISIASVWIENPEDGQYDKQDCELKAFKRLAEQLKKAFPRLPIIILTDSLYPNKSFFELCEQYRWRFSCTFKTGCLKTVWAQVDNAIPQQLSNGHLERRTEQGKTIVREYCWVNNLSYQGYPLNWMECRETTSWTETDKEGNEISKEEETSFVYLSDLPLTRNTIISSIETGRLRWKIENEGFNTLKNSGYGMRHKWARKSYRGLKNYYAFMQMAHLIHQLMTQTIHFQTTYLQGKNHPTLKHLWEQFLAAMEWVTTSCARFRRIAETRIQFRFVS